MKGKKRDQVCPKGGGEAGPSAPAQAGGGKRPPGIPGAIFSALFALLLAVAAALFVLLAFVQALSTNVQLPSAGAVSGEWLTGFFRSWYPIALGGALVSIPAAAVIAINRHRIRRAFAAIGASAVAAALCCAALGLAGPRVSRTLSGEWQDVLVHAVAAFRDLSMMCAVILIAAGAACLSAYACIAAVKGGKHEKSA